jgi:hypothetical protein
MRPDDGRIDDQIFEIWVIGHRLEDQLPNTLDAPSTEAPEHAVPNIRLFRPVEPFWAGRPIDQRVIRSQASSLNTKRSITPKAASPKRSLESDLLLKGNP